MATDVGFSVFPPFLYDKCLGGTLDPWGVDCGAKI
jgi:hypothetical protein